MYKLLIADDEHWLRRRLAVTMPWKENGIGTVIEAEDGASALSLAMEYEPDIIITDIDMPGLSGVELMRILYESALCPQIIVISGYDEFEYAQSAVRFGAQDYLLKPIDETELLRAVRRCTAELDRKWEEERARAERNAHNEERMRAESDANKEEPEKEEGHRHWIIEKAIRYLEEHYAESLTMSDVAEHVYLNSSYFSRLFREETGITFTNYLMRTRIGAAKKLMDDESWKLYDIAARVGYSNPQYFSTVFKEIEGVTPTQYREKGAKESEL